MGKGDKEGGGMSGLRNLNLVRRISLVLCKINHFFLWPFNF